MFRGTFLAAFSLVFLFVSCFSDPNDQVDEGFVSGNTYRSVELGWEVEIPEGWEIIQKDVMQEKVEMGADMASDMGILVDTKSLKYLISFGKDEAHIFQSSSEPFDETYPGEWHNNNKMLHGFLYDMYASKGIPVDTLSSSLKIDGVKFNVLYITLWTPDGEPVLFQEMYSSFINGYDFGVAITYRNAEFGEIMKDALLNSKFDQ